MKLYLIFALILTQALLNIEAYKIFYESEENEEPTGISQKDLQNLIFSSNLKKNSDSLKHFNQDERSLRDQVNDDFENEKILNQNLFEKNFYQQENPDEESESHSSLIGGHQYVSGGAGEGQQHLKPDGKINNKEETKSDEDLPAYCDPPNPCPLNYIGEDCDSRPYKYFTADFSKKYQEQQNCMCDEDHNECSKDSGPKSLHKINNLLKNIQGLSIMDKKVIKKIEK